MPKAVFHRNTSEMAFYTAYFDAVRFWVDDASSIVQIAREEAERHGLAAMDALHVAAAHLGEADVLYTFERKEKPMHRTSLVRVISIPDLIAEHAATVEKMAQVEKLYRIADGDVRTFLAERPDTLEFLIEARQHVEKQFGPDVQVRLRFPRLFPGEEPGIFAEIICDAADAESDARFDRFWDQWWSASSATARGKGVTFSLEFAEGASGEA